MSHINNARSINYIFSLAEDRDISFSVQSTNITDIAMGETPFPTSPADLYIPSNKIEKTPITLKVLVSEDYNEWFFFYKWLLAIKNSPMGDQSLRKSCELVALDSQNAPIAKFAYLDAFPTQMDGLQYSVQDENQILTFSITMRYNLFQAEDKDGVIYDDKWVGEIV